MCDGIDKLAFDMMEYVMADKTAVDLLGDKAEVTRDDVHNMLMVAGFTPGLGNIADAVDAVLYAAEGEFGAAGLSAAAMVPFIGQAVSAKKALKIAKESGEEMVTLWRGSSKWHQKSMVKGGKFVGGGHHVDPKIKESLWVTENKKYAENIAMEEGGVLLEFEVPRSVIDSEFTRLTRVNQLNAGIFEKGLDKVFLKKVHK